MVLPSVVDLTIDYVRKHLSEGTFTSKDLVKVFLDRIHQLNPVVHAVINVNDNAIQEAEGLDELRRHGTVLGPLHGIPILVKDNIGTKDIPTTAGSTALLDSKLDRDATVIMKLRDAGAIILGKANLTQWSNYRSSSESSSDGWSATGGQCTGVFHPGQNPGGSSSGNGVAIALGLAVASIATDTMGSIGNPAHMNGLVGISPTVGLVSRDMMMMFSEHQDCIGTLTRCVLDSAYILQAIAGKDPQDPYTARIPFEKVPDYPKACSLSGLKGARIGVPRATIRETATNRPSIEAFNFSLDVMRSCGAEIIEDANFSDFPYTSMWNDDAKIVYALDFKTAVKSYFSKLKHNPHSIRDLNDLIRYTKDTPEEEYPQRDVQRWIDAADLPYEDNSSPYFKEVYARHYWHSAEGGITGALDRYNLDALVLPEEFANHIPGPAGLPTVTVPVGVGPSDAGIQAGRGGLLLAGPNIPLAISFLGRHFSEETLIRYAYAFEQKHEAMTGAKKNYEPLILADLEIAKIP